MHFTGVPVPGGPLLHLHSAACLPNLRPACLPAHPAQLCIWRRVYVHRRRRMGGIRSRSRGDARDGVRDASNE